MCGALATAATSIRPIASNIKIHYVEMWAPCEITAGARQTIALEWSPFGNLGASNLETTDTTISNARPAHLFTKPPRGTNAEFWQDDIVDNTLWLMTGPAGTITDVHCSFMLNDSSPTSAIACSGATVGRLYYQQLDGTSNNQLPISLQHATP